MKCPICKFQTQCIESYKNLDKRLLCRHCNIYLIYSLVTYRITEYTKFIDINEITYIIHWTEDNETKIWKGCAATEDDLVVTFNFWIPILKDQNAMVNKLKTILTFI